MLEKHGRSIMIIANIVMAVTAVLTLAALANHTHDEDGNAIFTRPVVQE